MSMIVSDAIFLRRPKFDYISPPVCEVFISGSSFPVCIANAIAVPSAPTGLTLTCSEGTGTLSWDVHSLALKYTVYKADDPNTPEGSYSVYADCVDGTSLEVPCDGCYRVSAITLDGESDLSSPVCPGTPDVFTDSATDITGDSATLHGRANPEGSDTTVYFEWGTTTAYGNTTAPQIIGSGNDLVAFADVISGLSFGTEYHFRAVATNSVGTSFGPDESFTTVAFGPDSLSNLLLWLKADSFSVPDNTAVGAPGTEWLDQSGNNNDAFQPNPLSRPTFQVGVVNGKPVVRFDGSDDYLVLTTPLTFDPSGPTLEFTFIVVMSQIIDGGVTLGGSTINGNAGLQHNTFGTGIASLNGSTGAADSLPFSVPAGDFKQVNVARYTVILPASPRIWFRENNVAKGDGAPIGITDVKNIGARSDATLNFLQGDIAEIVVYSDAKTSAELDQLYTDYFQPKYAI